MTAVSIVIEMDNARLLEWDEVRETFTALTREVRARSASGAKVQLVFCQPGEPDDAARLEAMVRDGVPELAALAETDYACVPDGRYYDLKNAGIPKARGDIVVLLDSDTVPEHGWLETLLAPFSDPDIVCVNGYTSLSFDDFPSRVFALYWLFPLEANDRRAAGKRALNANNCAFRRDWIAANPFPFNPGFKVSCGLLWHRILSEKVPLARVDALVRHKPPRGMRFFFWRALVSGRDNDRRYALLKSPNRLRRAGHAVSRFLTLFWRALRRTVRHSGQVGIAPWQAPFALLVWCVFLVLTLIGQLGHALSPAEDRIEDVPEAVLVS